MIKNKIWNTRQNDIKPFEDACDISIIGLGNVVDVFDMTGIYFGKRVASVV